MDDPIFPNQPDDPVAPVQPPQPVQDQQRMDRLEQAMMELTSVVRDVGQKLPMAQGPVAHEQTTDEFLTEFSSDPRGLVTRLATQAAQNVATQQLTPAILRTLDLAASQLLSEQSQKVDSEIGAGTFDEFFRPQIDKDLSELRKTNPEALANRQVMEALVNRLYGGENFPVLSQRRRQLEQLAQQRGLSHLVPTGGAPRLRSLSGEPELHPEAEMFLREVDKSTGDQTDRKAFAKKMGTGSESGPGRHRTTLADWAKTESLTADQRKMYGIDKT